jgi:hypothetical protein
MPVEFLTDEQVAAYGSFREMPTRPELERFFFLDDDDRDLIALRRTDGHRLGMALQICTVRYLGLFLEDPLDVPWPVLEYLAAQLGITGRSCVKRYVERAKTAYEHSWEIRRRFGYHEFLDWAWGRRFRRFCMGGHGRIRRGRSRCFTTRWRGCGATGCCCREPEKASRTLARASRVLFTELESLEKRKATLNPTAVWAAIEKVASRAAVTSALATVEQLVPQDDGAAEIALRTALGARYNTVRPFSRLLGESARWPRHRAGAESSRPCATCRRWCVGGWGNVRCARVTSTLSWSRRRGARWSMPTARCPPGAVDRCLCGVRARAAV